MPGTLHIVAEKTTGEDLVRKVTLDWVADENGAVYGYPTKESNGTLLSFVTIPGTPAPNPGYDVRIVTEDGIDILQGHGLGRSDEDTQEVIANEGHPPSEAVIFSPVSGPLEFMVAGAGPGGAGTFKMFVHSVTNSLRQEFSFPQ